MKAKYVSTSLILLMLTLSGLCGITTTADAQEVHALIIILGNDKEIRDGVEKNEDLMVKMLKQLSDDCTVKLTVMKSKTGYQGEVSRITYANQNSRERKTTEQDIIESWQVAEWLERIEPKPEDTVLIYYCGHGEIDRFNTHELIFDPGVKADTPDRAKISQLLKEKRARLRMLITDTCSSPSRDLPESAFKRLAEPRERKRQNYPSDLFLKHEGFLDITAASPGQFAIAHANLGGHFTSAMLSHGFTEMADADRDNFLSWQETFEKTKAQTKVLYAQAEFDDKINADLRKNRQTTQEPFAYNTLPKRIDGGGGSGPPQPPVITPATIGQNGAKFDDTLLQGHTSYVLSVFFSPDGRTIASGSWDKTIRLWDASTGNHIRTLTGHTSSVFSVSFSPDGRTIASGSPDKTIRLWDASTGNHIRTLTGHTDRVLSVSFSPDGRTIASGSWDKTIRLWDASTGNHIRTLTGHTDYVLSVSFSPDGRTIASGSWDKTIRLWDASTGNHIRTLTGHTDRVLSVSFSPDGRTIASGSWDKTIRLWDASTGNHIRTLTGHTHWVYSVSFSPDGRTIASGSPDKTIRLWDASTGNHIRIPTGYTSSVYSVSFSPDGRTIASGSEDDTGRLWQLAD